MRSFASSYRLNISEPHIDACICQIGKYATLRQNPQCDITGPEGGATGIRS